jgi:hypothetical protein
VEGLRWSHLRCGRAEAFQRKVAVIGNAGFVVCFQDSVQGNDSHLVTIGELMKYVGALSATEVAITVDEVRIVFLNHPINQSLDGCS